MTMHRNEMAARLVKDPQSGLWSMEDGTTSYVSKSNEVLQGFQEMGYCENMCGSWDVVKGYLNNYLDILSTPYTTTPPPDMLPPCDALSYGLQFRSVQVFAHASDVRTTASPPNPSCPEPKHPAAPRQHCVCSVDGNSCTLPDAG
jgi:hypothetical protein